MAPEFFIIALTIIIGFFASLVFERTKISQVIILMLFGFLLGPVLGVLDVSSDSIMVSLLPFVGTLALIVLLFDGGLEFNIFAVARQIPKSMFFTILVFVISVIVMAGFIAFGLGWPATHALLLGAVIGGTSSPVVIALVERTTVKKETKSLLTVESTMTDSLCIITAVLIISIITLNQPIDVSLIFNLLLSQFTIALLFGFAGAALWIFIIDRVAIVQEYTYMLMLSLVFGVFAVTDFVGGSGGIAVFVFGIIIGNARKIAKFARLEWENPITKTTRIFQEEVTFFVRTFFFTYIGLLLSFEYFSIPIVAIAIALLGIVGLSRFAVQKILLPDLSKIDKSIVVTMMPRGLAAAVLVTLPLTAGIELNYFQEIVFTVILLSNIAATGGIFMFDRDDIDKDVRLPFKPRENGKTNSKNKKKKG